jgi:hypothetical protein
MTKWNLYQQAASVLKMVDWVNSEHNSPNCATYQWGLLDKSFWFLLFRVIYEKAHQTATLSIQQLLNVDVTMNDRQLMQADAQWWV